MGHVLLCLEDMGQFLCRSQLWARLGFVVCQQNCGLARTSMCPVRHRHSPGSAPRPPPSRAPLCSPGSAPEPWLRLCAHRRFAAVRLPPRCSVRRWPHSQPNRRYESCFSKVFSPTPGGIFSSSNHIVKHRHSKRK
jgi:hypothetical protein